MDVSEMHNCDKKQTEIEDDDESLMEKCWGEEYKGDSRKWLIRDASAKMARKPLCSTMKESFLYPQRETNDSKKMGIRKALLLKKFYEDASAEIINETTISLTEPNDYCTEYDGNFKADDFKPDDKYYTKNKELFQKYPLYSSPPVSYYSFNLQKNPKEVLHGLTKVLSPTNVFKRNGQFSKPLSERLDNIEL